MLNNSVFYHGIIRKTIVAFGQLFSNIYIDRREGNSVTGNAVQRLQVPIAYAPKEKWITRLEQDPELENNTYIVLPRISFEITGYSYDSSRKLGKMNRIVCNDGLHSNNIFAPVPWMIDISLYVLTKTQEDGLQIIEQILPTFTPEYTISVNAIPTMNVVQDIPITLNSCNVTDEYDGSFDIRRFVTYTLNFTLKINLYGPVHDSKLILDTTANISSLPDYSNKSPVFNAVGDPNTFTITLEGWDE
jgi:hypothetical protein